MKVTDDTRIREIAPTAKFLLSQGASLILLSHFGRPDGKVVERGKNGRLNPLIPHLERVLGVNVRKVNDCVGPYVTAAVKDLKAGEVLLLENTRFHEGEEKNDDQLSKQLGALAKYFVMDAFGTAHRAHSSTAGVAKYVDLAAAGYLLDKELRYLQGAVDNPKRPLAAIVGGAKVSTKIPVIESLIGKCDTILLGGGMVFTFYKALGYEVGASLVEEKMVPLAKRLMDLAASKNVKLLLPTDVVIADKFDKDANSKVVTISKEQPIPAGWMGLDIGPDTITRYGVALSSCSTMVWNGPMGVFEFPKFAAGTNAVAKIMADESRKRGAVTIVGGGDSVAAVNALGLGGAMSHISTGGGASLELLEGKILPGVEALTDA